MKQSVLLAIVFGLLTLPLILIYFTRQHSLLPLNSGIRRYDLIPIMIIGNGLLPMAMYAIRYFEARTFTRQYIERQVLTARYRTWLRYSRGGYSFTLTILLLLAGLYIVQVHFGEGEGDRALEESILNIGLVKSKAFDGQWWRLATAPFLHGSLLHLYSNLVVLWIVGLEVERTSSSGVAAMVFLSSAIGGSFLSLLLLPETSIGASGGIAGLIAFLIVLGWHHRKILPQRFAFSFIFISLLIAGFGIWLSRITDNMAHLGGFIVGALIGNLLVVHSRSGIPLVLTKGYRTLGYICMTAVCVIPIFITVYLTLHRS